MREPNKNKVYSLDDLTRNEKIELGNNIFKPENLDNVFKFPYIRYNKEFKTWLATECAAPTHNAKELFYTLDNIQVDCRELSEDKIKEMINIFVAKSVRCGGNMDLNKDKRQVYLYINYNNITVMDRKHNNKTTINYEKFMELFGRKEENFKKLVEVLNEELTEEYNKETEYEVKYIAEKPTHPSIAILDKAIETLNELEAYKETANKLNYELDFNFITQLAERMAQNKHKYKPYNWQKLDNVAELKQALFRHVLEVMNGNYEDDNRLFGHLESIALNAMFINYQLKKTQ